MRKLDYIFLQENPMGKQEEDLLESMQHVQEGGLRKDLCVLKKELSYINKFVEMNGDKFIVQKIIK